MPPKFQLKKLSTISLDYRNFCLKPNKSKFIAHIKKGYVKHPVIFINIRPTNGMLPTLVLATTDGSFMMGNKTLSKSVECGAATAIGASLGRAGLPLITVQ